YAKATPEDILIRATATNRGPEPATLHFLPTIWFRNTWSWGRDARKPSLREATPAMIEARHDGLGNYEFHCENAEQFLFTENESNLQRLWGAPNHSAFVKDSINDAVIHNKIDIVNPGKTGTKAAAHYRFIITPNDSRTIRLRLRKLDNDPSPADSVVCLSPGEGADVRETPPFHDFDEVLAARKAEADEFYHSVTPVNLPSEHR